MIAITVGKSVDGQIWYNPRLSVDTLGCEKERESTQETEREMLTADRVGVTQQSPHSTLLNRSIDRISCWQ